MPKPKAYTTGLSEAHDTFAAMTGTKRGWIVALLLLPENDRLSGSPKGPLGAFSIPRNLGLKVSE